jgi:pimeloyl-ACP methyl ester carboxylesterase
MTILTQTRRSIPARSAFGIVAIALLAAPPTSADVIRGDDMLRGISTTRAQCDATPQTVWATVFGQGFCVRYYLSTAGGEGSRPVVFLSGDKLGKLNPKTWTWTDTSEAKDVDTDDLVRMADDFSKFSKTTAIYLARIGVDGTSGSHVSRKTVLELRLMNAALDALKERYGFEGFHLAGQSGGSLLVAALIEMRRDIACAVLGSAPLSTPGSSKVTDPGRTFITIGDLTPVVRNLSIRPLLVTDKEDKRVPAADQTAFVDRLRKAGRVVPEFFVEATDELHHGVVSYDQLIMGLYTLGKSDEVIARVVRTMVPVLGSKR